MGDKYGLSREEQDAFAAASQQKAVAARDAGVFDKEITPVSIPQRKGDALLRDWAREFHYGQLNAQKCPKCKVKLDSRNRFLGLFLAVLV